MDDKLTRKSQEALSAAVRRAAADGNPQVDPLHLLLALIEQADGTDRSAAAGGRRRPGAGRQAGRGAPGPAAARPRAPRSARRRCPGRCSSAIATASSRAKQLGDEYISTEHLLVGLAADGGDAKTVLRAARRHA